MRDQDKTVRSPRRISRTKLSGLFRDAQSARPAGGRRSIGQESPGNRGASALGPRSCVPSSPTTRLEPVRERGNPVAARHDGAVLELRVGRARAGEAKASAVDTWAFWPAKARYSAVVLTELAHVAARKSEHGFQSGRERGAEGS